MLYIYLKDCNRFLFFSRKTYLDIQRREQAFDLSEPYKPLRYPQANLTVPMYFFLL